MSHNFPDVVRIETVGACNFSCKHCPTGIEPNNRSILKPEKFNDIINQFKKESFVPRVVVLYHGGEPLLNKWLVDYIKILKDYGVKKTVITTNGSLLTEKVSKRLILNGLDQMTVSFDGLSPKENNEIRLNGNFERDSQNLLNFMRLKKTLGKNNPEVIISNVRISNKISINQALKNKFFDEIPGFILKTFNEYKDEIIFRSFPAMVWPGFKMSEDFEIVEGSSRNEGYCSSLFETTTILSNGNVAACCYDLPGETNFGNVSLQSIFKIWENKKYKQFREQFEKKQYPKICMNCHVVKPRLLLGKSTKYE